MDVVEFSSQHCTVAALCCWDYTYLTLENFTLPSLWTTLCTPSTSKQPQQLPVTLKKNNNSPSSQPEPHVGATVVLDAHSDGIHLWGDRRGVDMSPLGRLQSGIFRTFVGGQTLKEERLQSRMMNLEKHQT